MSLHTERYDGTDVLGLVQQAHSSLDGAIALTDQELGIAGLGITPRHYLTIDDDRIVALARVRPSAQNILHLQDFTDAIIDSCAVAHFTPKEDPDTSLRRIIGKQLIDRIIGDLVEENMASHVIMFTPVDEVSFFSSNNFYPSTREPVETRSGHKVRIMSHLLPKKAA